MMTGRRRPMLLATISFLAAGLAALAGAVPAGAASAPGWRIVSETDYPNSTVQSGSGYGAVVATSASDAWVFGGTDQGSGNGIPEAEHWNGTTWAPATLPSGLTGYIDAASAPASNDIWAVSELNGWILHYNGTSWSVAKRFAEPTTGYPSAFTGITALSPTNVWVFGGVGTGPLVGFGAWHYNGSTWTQNTGPGRNTIEASAISASNIWAIGGYYDAYDGIDHYNGSTWQAVTEPSFLANGERYVAAYSSASVWVDGMAPGTEAPVLGHWTGSSWTQVATGAPADSELDAITGDGAGGLNVIANSKDSNQCWILHMSSSGAWTSTALTADAQIDSAFRVPGTTSVWGAGSLFGPSTYAVIWADGTLP